MRFFISYSRSVKQETGKVVDLLRAAGHEVWWDGDIPEIADWWATILDKIEWCQVFIFVVSEKSVQSPYCLKELSYATDRNRPILPFVIDDHTRYTIPPEVTPMRNQWFVYDGNPARMLDRIIQACSQIVWDKYPDLRAPRPIEPNTGSGSLVKLFQQAVSLAEDGRFDEAIKRFRNVASLDHNEWGRECQQWIGRLQTYGEIAEMADHKATRRRAQEKWANYVKQYDDEFDPLNVRDKLIDSLPKRAHSRVYDILPAPFAWVDIPAGQVTLEEGGYTPKGGQTFNVPAFAIAKYPVTNIQFAKFIDSGGYREKRWWTSAGWQVREKEKWTQPRYWTDKKWNSADYPVVGVSWYESLAFCRWLSEVSSENILLPTEQQWQRAAQGDDNRIYPWGNDWDGSRCNNSVGKDWEQNQTSPVIQYEGKGDSPFGVVDMAGNVWEWCLTAYETGSTSLDGTDVRVLRGGSRYDYNTLDFRAAYRFRYYPGDWDDYLGFRVSRFN